MGERTEIRTRIGPLWPGMVHCRCGLSVALQSTEGYWRTEGKTIRDETGLRCPDCRDLLVRDPAAQPESPERCQNGLHRTKACPSCGGDLAEFQRKRAALYRDLALRAVDIHAEVQMDTDEDRRLHDKAIRTLRDALRAVDLAKEDQR